MLVWDLGFQAEVWGPPRLRLVLRDRLVDCYLKYVMSAYLGLVAVVRRLQMRAEGVARRRHMFANVALDPRATFRACLRVNRAHERQLQNV